MKTEYQDLEWAIPKVKKQFIKNPHRSISATFRYLRNHPRFSLIGDYPILWIILHTVLSLGIKVSRMKLLYALNQSTELKVFSPGNKNELLDELLKPSSVQMGKGESAR